MGTPLKVESNNVADPQKLRPAGVLERMKRIYVDRLSQYMDEVGGELSLKEECRKWVSCYLCGSKRTDLFLKASGFQHVKCKECGLVYVNPRLQDHIIDAFYQSDAYQFMFDNMLIKSLDYRLEVIAPRKFKSVAGFFKNRKPKLLDVGCGIGEFLHVAQANGWDGVGIEFSPRAVDFARKELELEIFDRPVNECQFQDGQFDIVTMWGVLEHLTNPNEILADLKRFIAEKGLLVVEVPSFDCLLVEYLKHRPEQADRIVDGWGHLMLFSLPTISRMLEKNGFEVVDACSLGLDIATVLRYMRTETPEVENHPLYQFVAEYGQLLQDGIESIHKADMIRVFARKA